MTRQTIWHYFQRNRSMFQFLTHVELSMWMVAILEMPQYMAYQKHVAYAFIKLCASFTVLTFCAQWMCLAALLQNDIQITCIQYQNCVLTEVVKRQYKSLTWRRKIDKKLLLPNQEKGATIFRWHSRVRMFSLTILTSAVKGISMHWMISFAFTSLPSVMYAFPSKVILREFPILKIVGMIKNETSLNVSLEAPFNFSTFLWELVCVTNQEL